MKKKVLLISVIIFVIVICSIVGMSIFIKQRDAALSLIQNNVVIEYGETYNPTIENLIDLSNFDFVDETKTNIESNIENEENKEYPKVGVYEVYLYYKNITLTQTVEVKDSTPPELTIQESVEIPKNTDLTTYNFEELISITDLSEVNDYSIDFSNVNSNENGEYIAKISVDDIYSNKAEKEFKIIILEDENEVIEETISTETSTNNTTSNKTTNSTSTTSKNNSTTSNSNNSQTNTNTSTSSSNSSTNTQNSVSTENEVQQTITRCTTTNNHGMDVGNSGKWFTSKSEAVEYYNNQLTYWSNLCENNQIDINEYYANCPYGYEVWNCPYCGKWTINFYYR